MSTTHKNGAAVSELVNKLVAEAKARKTDGPASSLHGARAQLASTLNQAGTLLAQIERAAPARKPSLLNTVLGLSAKRAAPRRGWFSLRRAEDGPTLSAGRIEKLLKATAKDGVRLSLADAVTRASEGDVGVECVLPEGASDPVCSPRR